MDNDHSITYELREWAGGALMRLSAHEELTAIADRIEAAHEETILQALMGEGGVPATDENMAERGWVRLPKDADGVPIRVGDVLTDDAEFKSEGKVMRLMLEDEGWMVGFECGGWTNPSIHELHHHHTPTVEDVLRGVVTLCHNTWKEESPFHFCDVDDVMKSGNIAEFAAKLRLAGDAE